MAIAMSTPSDVLHFARKIGSSGNKKLASDSKAQQRCHNWASQKGGGTNNPNKRATELGASGNFTEWALAAGRE